MRHPDAPFYPMPDCNLEGVCRKWASGGAKSLQAPKVMPGGRRHPTRGTLTGTN